MIGKTLGHYQITCQLGKGGMGEVYQAKDQKLGRDVAIKVLPEEFVKEADRVARFQHESGTNRTTNQRVRLITERSFPVLLTAILYLSLGILQSEKSFAKDIEIKPEELVAKHLNSIGKPETLAAIESRSVEGTASVQFIQRGFGRLPNGQFLLVSKQRKLGIVMKFDAIDYPGEHFVFDGHNAAVAYLDFDTKSRLGTFITRFYGLLKEGLLGGTLSVAWPLLDVAERQPKLKYRKRIIEGRQLHELTYEPRSRSGALELQIKLFFDFETFRHVMTQYSYSNLSGPTVKMLLQEQFDDFREVDGLMLPHRYAISYSEEPAFIGRWTIKVERWRHNAQIDPKLFKAQPLR